MTDTEPTWTEERTELLRQLSDRMEPSEIARRMNLTRNQVIGKQHRLRIAKKALTRAEQAALQELQRERAARRAERKAELRRIARERKALEKIKAMGAKERALHEAMAAPVVAREDLPPLCADVEALEPHSCRWIPGEVGSGFCGRHKAHPDLPYCEHHIRRAFVPRESAVASPHMVLFRRPGTGY